MDLMENTDKHWRLWGELDPYRGVCYPDGLTAGFWQSGERYVESLLNKIGPVARGSALDFGCGVGRILRPLAARFQYVAGVDIAPAMLSHATRNVPSAELQDHIPQDRQYDLVHSCLVLQHVPVERGLEIIRQLQRCCAPGGVLAIQVPLEMHHSLVYRAKHAVPWLRFLFNVLQGKPVRMPLMQMNAYSASQIEGVVGAARWLENPPCEAAVFVWRREA